MAFDSEALVLTATAEFLWSWVSADCCVTPNKWSGDILREDPWQDVDEVEGPNILRTRALAVVDGGLTWNSLCGCESVGYRGDESAPG